MAETAAWIIDAEGFMGSCSRVRGHAFRPDIVRIVQAIQALRADRSNLWIKWIASTYLSDGGSNPFFRYLQRQGFRIELVEGKPISRTNGRLEANACDFAVIKAIRVAQKKADTIVLVGSDGHFAHALDEAHGECGCRIEVVCDRQGLSSLISADHFYYLDDILGVQDFSYRPTHAPGSRPNGQSAPSSSSALRECNHDAA